MYCLKALTKEFFNLKDELKEFSSMQKRVSKLEISSEKSKNDKKDQLKAIKDLEHKVKGLQKAIDN